MSEMVKYCHRMVAKDGFRTWVYSKDSKKLASSWDDYVSLVESGLWFSSKDDIPAPVEHVSRETSKPKPKPRKRKG